MFARALLAFLAMPGVVAFAIPVAWIAHSHARLDHPLGLVLLCAGCIGLLWCVRDFYVCGKGTLAPWSPPIHLVKAGLYRYSRNPMYVAVALILLGWATAFGLRPLYLYTLVVVLAFHLRVVFGEEPWLARTHGDDWNEYSSRVPRWFWHRTQ